MLRLLLGTVAVFFLNATALTAVAQSTGPRVHSLIIAAQDDELPDAQIGGSRLKDLLNKARSEQQDVFKTVQVLGLGDGRRLTAQSIKAKVEQTFSAANDFQPDDTIFCYVFTHGSHSTNHQLPFEKYEHGHFFQVQNVQNPRIGVSYFARSDLFETLLDQRQTAANSTAYSHRLRGLTILISDSCNNALDISVDSSASGSSGTPPKLNLERLTNLLTKYQGQISVNSSSPGELAWYGVDVGGRFSDFFVKNMKYGSSTTWTGLIKEVEADLIAEFESHPGGIKRRRYINANGRDVLDPKVYKKQTPMWMRAETRVRVRP